MLVKTLGSEMYFESAGNGVCSTPPTPSPLQTQLLVTAKRSLSLVCTVIEFICLLHYIYMQYTVHMAEHSTITHMEVVVPSDQH